MCLNVIWGIRQSLTVALLACQADIPVHGYIYQVETGKIVPVA